MLQIPSIDKYKRIYIYIYISDTGWYGSNISYFMTFVVLKDAMQSAGIQRKGISDLTQNLTLVAMLLP